MSTLEKLTRERNEIARQLELLNAVAASKAHSNETKAPLLPRSNRLDADAFVLPTTCRAKLEAPKQAPARSPSPKSASRKDAQDRLDAESLIRHGRDGEQSASILADIKRFRDDYLRSGGADISVLAELAAMEQDALRIAQPQNQTLELPNPTACPSKIGPAAEPAAATTTRVTEDPEVERLNRKHKLRMLRLSQKRELLAIKAEVKDLKAWVPLTLPDRE
ncbi:hypothetical protein HK105_201263 [Polyrhizophydium stewartii]|uniref:Uncharacterized protein n=1 Tax=Polyrhizophydium stewartii TaxID=2732419 RepID=A0ABR4NHI3_9FUNG